MRIRTTFSGGPEAEFGPGFSMPVSLRIRVSDWNGYDLDIEVELEDRRYRCKTLTMRHCGEETDLPGGELPDVPVSAMISRGVRTYAADAWVMKSGSIEGPTEENLQVVARLYTLATALGDPPRKAVESQFDIPTWTAARWIARARDAGYLTESSSGGRPSQQLPD